MCCGSRSGRQNNCGCGCNCGCNPRGSWVWQEDTDCGCGCGDEGVTALPILCGSVRFPSFLTDRGDCGCGCGCGQ